MEQQQIKVSFSVGTKLVISVVSLLFIVIVFLNITTILLYREDKRAYVYETQSTHALLAGKEFVNTAQLALDTLRISLATIDPRKPLQSAQSATFQSITNNQTQLLSTSIYLLD